MSLLSEVAARTARATGGPSVPRSGSLGASAQTIYADDYDSISAEVPATGGGPVRYIVIMDTRTGLSMVWPEGMPLPAGYMVLSGVRPGDMSPGRPVPRAGTTTVFEPDAALGEIIRRAAEKAAQAAEEQAARERLTEQRRVAGLTKVSALLFPGVKKPRTTRGPRAPRRSRAPRIPRPPRPPRAPRAAGTKRTKWGAWCRPVTPRCITSQGPCVAWPLGDAVPQNQGYCQGSIIASCRGCYQGSCSGPYAEQANALLKYLPTTFKAEPAVTPPPPAATREYKRVPGTRFSGLGPLAAADRAAAEAEQQATGQAIPAGGCTCQDWPGWVICPKCAHSAKCRCSSKCIPFPANTNLCGG